MTLTAKPLVFRPHDNGLNRPHWQALVGEHMALYEIRDLAAFNPDTPPDSRFSLFSHLSRVSSWHATLAAAEVAGQADWQAFVCAVVEETPLRGIEHRQPHPRNLDSDPSVGGRETPSLFPCPPQTGMDRSPPPRT